MIADYPWGRSYEAAILETDRSRLAKHIQLAEQTIMARIQELNCDHGGTDDERAAIRDAMSGLTMLRNELLQSVPEGSFGRTSGGAPSPQGSSGQTPRGHGTGRKKA